MREKHLLLILILVAQTSDSLCAIVLGNNTPLCLFGTSSRTGRLSRVLGVFIVAIFFIVGGGGSFFLIVFVFEGSFVFRADLLLGIFLVVVLFGGGGGGLRSGFAGFLCWGWKRMLIPVSVLHGLHVFDEELLDMREGVTYEEHLHHRRLRPLRLRRRTLHIYMQGVSGQLSALFLSS